MSDHTLVIVVSRRFYLLAAALLGLVLVGCGPTANALRPTLPPRTPQTGSTFAPGGPLQDGASVEPPASVTPPQPGIAHAMASFPQGTAYEVNSVTATPTGYVAVGDAGAQGLEGVQQGVVWASSDGSTWQESLDPAFIGVSPGAVVALGDDLYVIGLYSSCTTSGDSGDGGDVFGDGSDGTNAEADCTEDPNAGTVIFRSASGGPWEQLAQTSDIIKAEFDGVRAWDGKLVAWGEAGDDTGTTTIWTSSDGLNWSPATNIAGVDPVYALGVGGPGLVAFGSQYLPNVTDDELIGASSSDGVNFTATIMPQVTGASVSDAVSGPGGMVAVGFAATDNSPSLAMTIFSADGITWSPGTASDGSFEDSEQNINEIHSSASEYVAVGSLVTDEDTGLETARVWVSADGQAWRSLGDFGGSFSQYGASALGANGLVAFTENDSYPNGDQNANPITTIYGWTIPTSQLAP